MVLQYAEGLEQKVDLRRVNLDALKPWIADKVSRLLNSQDSVKVPPDVAIDYCYKQLSSKGMLVNGKQMQDSISTLIQGKPARLYMAELWPLLVSAQSSPMGIPMAMIEAKKREILAREGKKSKIDKIGKKIDLALNDLNGKAVEEGMRKYNVNSGRVSKIRDASRDRSRSNSKRKRSKSRSRSKSKKRSTSRRRSKSRSSSRSKSKKLSKSEEKKRLKKKKDSKKRSSSSAKKKTKVVKKKKKKRKKKEESSSSSSPSSSSSTESSSSSDSDSSEDEKAKKKKKQRKKKLKKKSSKKKTKKTNESDSTGSSDDEDSQVEQDEEVPQKAEKPKSLSELEKKLRERAISSMRKKSV